jgi:hypothetical protein
MKTMIKPAVVLGLAGALALGSMTPSEARSRAWVGAGIGLAAGAAIAGAAVAANSGYYGGYYGGYGGYGYDAYAYDPGYAYGSSYGYAPAPVYGAPVYAAPTYSYPYSDNYRYSPNYGGYNSNYTGPLRERTLLGRDY